MKTNGNHADTSAEYIPLADGSNRDFFRQSASEQAGSNALAGIEQMLKAIWSEYVEHQDKCGFDDKAKDLKQRYFDLYQCYRRNKNWKQMISSNQ